MTRDDYVRAVLDAYLRLIDTPTTSRPNDRLLAGELYRQQVPLQQVQAALLLAAERRAHRSRHLPPLAPIHSLHYVLPILDEIHPANLDPDYLDYLQTRRHTNRSDERTTAPTTTTALKPRSTPK
jgi:hypothetical protein